MIDGEVMRAAAWLGALCSLVLTALLSFATPFGEPWAARRLSDA